MACPVDNVTVDFKKVMEHVWFTRAQIAPHDSAERYKEMGVDIYFGEAKFTSTNTVEVKGQTLEFKKCAIAPARERLKFQFRG